MSRRARACILSTWKRQVQAHDLTLCLKDALRLVLRCEPTLQKSWANEYAPLTLTHRCRIMTSADNLISRVGRREGEATLIQETGRLLASLRQQAQIESLGMNEECFAITSLVKIQAQFRPSEHDSPYSDVIVVAQTTGSGSCYCYCEDPVMPTDILGADARYIQPESRCVEIAVLDAAYSNLLPVPDILCNLEGTPTQKAKARASLITAEIQRLAQKAGHRLPSITMVGAVGNLLSDIVSLGWQVHATDLDPALVGKRLAGILVEEGHSMTLERVSQSHIALVTGMTLSTGTLEDIVLAGKSNDTRIAVFAQTGGNFAGELLKMGVDCVISEEYPFYMFPGVTKLRIFRANGS